MEVISRLIISLIATLSWGYVIRIVSDKRIKPSKINILLFILIVLLSYIVLSINIGFSKTLIIYLIFTIFYKIVYKIEFSKSLILVFISVFIHCISEIILSIITLMLQIDNVTLEKYLEMTPLSGLLIFIIVIIICKIFREKIKSIEKKLSKENIANIFYVVLMIFMAILFSVNINKNTWESNTFIINGITIIIFMTILLFLLKERLNYIKVNTNFNTLYKNSKEVSSLLEKYRKINHENKNDLRFIRGKSQGNKEVIEYINDILEEKNIKEENRWISELNKINEPGINTFLSIKINSMIDDDIKIVVDISNKIKKYAFNELSIKEQKSLCRMLGVYLDNAYQAAKKSKDKVISIEMNIVDKELRIIISNTFKGKVELDKIGKYGYTTKGKEHGAGLSLVNDILEKNDIFSHDTKIINNFFFQFIYIKK